MILMALALAQAAPILTLDGARAMAPVALADALLGAGHGPIAKVEIRAGDVVQRKDGLTGVTFVGVAGPAPDRKDWCRRTITTVWVVPVDTQARLVATTPTRVDKVESWPFYRLADGDCAAAEAIFFPLRSATGELALMDKMVAARDLARHRGWLPFALSCVDVDGGREGLGPNRCLEGSGRGLLADLPLEQTYNIWTAGRWYRWNGNEPASSEPREAQIWMSDGFQIDATISEQDGKVTAIKLRRHITAPP